MNQSAVLITAYNRPEFLENRLVSLKDYEGTIYVSLDYPKDFSTQGEAYAKNLAVCGQYSSTISHFQTFSSNQGCFLGVTKAITWAFENEQQLIILEDDIEISQSFLRFANTTLEKFRDNQLIGSVSGLNLVPQGFQTRGNLPLRLSLYTASWGWATWKNRWEDYLSDLDSFPRLDWSWPSSHWSLSEEIYWRRIFRSIARGDVDSWAYRWMYSNWKRRRWTLTPNENLTLNLGYGVDATHTKDHQVPWWLPKTMSHEFEVKEFSSCISPDFKADKWVSKNHFRTKWVYQFRAHMGIKFPKISKFVKIFLPRQ